MEILTWVRTQWDRTLALLAMLIGLLALLLGWIGVSGSSYVAKQLPYVISGGIFGIVLVAVAGVLWLSADLRDEWRELRGLRVQLRAHVTDLNAATGAGHAASSPPPEQLTSEFPALTDYPAGHSD